jgi:hypothetical protein
VRVIEAGKGWQRELEHTLLDDGDVLLCEDHLETVSTISMHQNANANSNNQHTLSVSLGLAGWRSRVVVTIRVQSQNFR